MSQAKWLDKYLTIKPEVNKIFDDLEAWHDHCRFELINFDPTDLYRSKEYKDWQRTQEYLARKARREAKARREQNDRISN
jgi:hypothetical protein